MAQVSFNQAICSSRESEQVVRFEDETFFNTQIVNMIHEGQIWGVYYDENNRLVAEDIWGEIHENITTK